eukprot:CAMPEP_0116047034 /NCGR_PEP_ID=MMETSP0321-20121206/28632_1 /TAXON_ID=163516 /ORGANISM="Leptocylindrus danicus var. danicus, Strain B650" /LENGTH=535 /DNA_ID=CAMNT_0003528799 /DNA_START=30 /DNA_END=1637 /DNA_ORIENTATION=+
MTERGAMNTDDHAAQALPFLDAKAKKCALVSLTAYNVESGYCEEVEEVVVPQKCESAISVRQLLGEWKERYNKRQSAEAAASNNNTNDNSNGGEPPLSSDDPANDDAADGADVSAATNGAAGASAGVAAASDEPGEAEAEAEVEEVVPSYMVNLKGDTSYCLQDSLVECEYGEVQYVVILKKRKETKVSNSRTSRKRDAYGMLKESDDDDYDEDDDDDDDDKDDNGDDEDANGENGESKKGKTLKVDWDLTRDDCCVKVMGWDKLAENLEENADEVNADTFLKEVEVLEYLATCPRPADDSVRILNRIELLYDDDNLYSFMPYYDGGNLWNRIEETENISEPEARYWVRQILRSLKYLHGVASISHRDLSPENVMIHEDKCIFVDYGRCVRVPFTIDSNGNRVHKRLPIQGLGNTPGGKLPYTPPEIVHNRDGTFDMFTVDMWAVGIILFNMLVGNLPFEMPSTVDHYDAYLRRLEIRMRITRELGLVSDGALLLIRSLLNEDARERLTVQQALEDTWLQVDDGYSYTPREEDGL